MSTTKRGYNRRSKPGTRCHKPRAITAQDALAMLESAVSYCQQAGLQIAGENADEKNADQAGLVLFIPGAHYVLTDNGTRAAFRLDAARVSAQDAGADVSAQGETAPRIGTCQADVSAQDAPNIGAGVSAHAGAAQATP